MLENLKIKILNRCLPLIRHHPVHVIAKFRPFLTIFSNLLIFLAQRESVFLHKYANRLH